MATQAVTPKLSLEPGSKTALGTGLDRFDVGMLACMLIAYLMVAALPFSPRKLGDLEFHLEAKSLVLAMKGLAPWSTVTIIRAPSPVIYYAIPYALVRRPASDNDYWLAAYIWNAICMAIALLLLRRTAAVLGDDTTGKLAVAIAFLVPFWIYYSHGVIGEPPAFLSAIIASYGWSRYSQHGGAGWAMLAGAGLIFLILAKPGVILAAGLIIPAGYSWLRHGEHKAKTTVIILALALAASFVCSALLKARYSRPGMTPQTKYFVWDLFFGSFQFRTEPWDWRFWDDSTRQNSNDYQAFQAELTRLKSESVRRKTPLSDLEWQWAFDDVRTHLWLHSKMAAIRAISMQVMLVNSVEPTAFHIGLIRGKVAYWFFHVIVNFFNLFLVILSIGFVVSRTKAPLSLWILWAPWLALLCFHSAIYAEPRYLFPGQVGLIIMSSLALSQWLVRCRNAIRQ
jgi:hypothetical protein